MRAPSIPIKVREAALVAVGIAALLGAVFAAFDLWHAMRRAEALYSVGMAGLSIEGDLQDYTQESRRLFVYALTTKDPNIQLTYVKAARASDREVARLQSAFSRIQLDPVAQSVLARLTTDWKRYLAVRDELIGLILEDSSDQALSEELAQGAPLFEQCARSLQELKRLLDKYAREQLVAVQQTYYRCAGEVGLMIVTMILFIGSLRMLTGLKRRNQSLTEAELVERQRSLILEWISQSAPLDRIFAEIESLVGRGYPDARAVISSNEDRYSILDAAGSAPEGLPRIYSILLVTNQQEISGTLSLYSRKQGPLSAVEIRFLERAAQLAILAIEHRLVTDQLAYQAQHDSLTGLANRLKFQERLEEAIAQASRETGELAVLWIDLDRFKQVNDVLGHHAGDLLLQQVARRLLRCAAGTEGSAVARIGGDEFIVLLPGCGEEKAAVVAAAILGLLSRPTIAMTQDIGVSASIGVSCFPRHGEDPETLLKNADTAMYSAKSLGKSGYQVYERAMGMATEERFEIDRLLQTALQDNQFEVYYQPQIGPRGIECVEALVRWHSPSLGMVSPTRFIPVAEENGTVVPLGAWVLRQACFQTSAWNAQGYGPLRVAVNVSAHQFVRSDFAAAVAQALADSGLDPTLLELELTETAVMSNIEQTLGQFQKLRRLGINIAIDDFGTGNSSLSYLRQLPVDTLKIDRSFIEDIDAHGGGTRQLIRAIVGMAHGLGLRVVAEGVETERQYDVIQSEGCDLSQGYLHHKPMPAGELGQMLAGAHMAASDYCPELAHQG
jgi:diguanylate cyclase (GGDEF)-like protein